MKKVFIKILFWLGNQHEWLKGFFEEETPTGSRKASQKRLISFLTSATFLYSYLAVLLKKTYEISNIKDIQLPDIPTQWSILIGFILGINVVSNVLSNKKNEDKK